MPCGALFAAHATVMLPYLFLVHCSRESDTPYPSENGLFI